MILSFIQTWDGVNPNNFPEKINYSILAEHLASDEITDRNNELFRGCQDFTGKVSSHEMNSKKHTIRFVTPKQFDQWKKWEQENKNIQFIINKRTKNQFQFAEAPLKFVQEVNFSLVHKVEIISIDRKSLTVFEAVKFIKNDGFNGLVSFQDYFTKELIERKVIEGKTKIALIAWAGEKY